MKKKICKRCFQEFDENENLSNSPTEALAEIFLESVGRNAVMIFARDVGRIWE